MIHDFEQGFKQSVKISCYHFSIKSYKHYSFHLYFTIQSVVSSHLILYN